LQPQLPGHTTREKTKRRPRAAIPPLIPIHPIIAVGTGLPKDWLDARKMASKVAQPAEKEKNVGNVASSMAERMM